MYLTQSHHQAPGASKHLANKTVQAKNANDAVVSTPSDATREPSLAPSNDDSQADHDMDGNGNGNGNGTGQLGMKGLSGQSTSDNAIDREQEERNINAEIEANMGMIQDEIWRELTKKTRAKVSVIICDTYFPLCYCPSLTQFLTSLTLISRPRSHLVNVQSLPDPQWI